MSIIAAGLMLGFSLIIAVGPQNIFLLKQGISRDAVTAVVLTCVLSDVLLITVGVSGVGVLADRAPALLEVLRWLGVAYLLWFAVSSFRDAARPGSVAITETAPADPVPDATGGSAVLTRTRTAIGLRRPEHRTWVRPVLTALVLTWLNPAAYVDVVVVVGSLANQYGPDGRWLFALGAFLAATIWFPAVGYGAAALRRPLSRPDVWRWLNLAIGIVLIIIAVRIAVM